MLSIYDGINAAHGAGMPTNLFGSTGVITLIVNVLLFAVGAISVIMIMIGGLRYVISGGNSSAVTGAKNTIMYAIIGLIVAFLGYAIINFVLSVLTGGFNGSGYAPTNV